VDNLSIIDHFTDVFSRVIDSGFGLLHGEVTFLTTTLVVMDMVLAGLFWALEHATGCGSDIQARLIRKVLYVGAFAYLLNNFNTLSGIIFKSFTGLGLIASGSALTAAQFLQPGRLAQVGVDTGAPLLAQIGRLAGFTSIFANFETIVVLLLAWIIVILSFFVLSVQLFITLIEFKLTTLGGFILVPFALWSKTAFLAERVLGNVVSSGVKVLMLAVIVGISTTVFNDFRAAVGTTPTMEQASAVMLAALAMLGLGIFGPLIATGLVSGAPQLGAGAAAGTIMGAAGVAVAGAAVAGMGARAGLGGVRAAASMAGGARGAYALGAAASGETGMKAAAAGMAGMARAGASAASSRFKAAMMGAAGATTGAAGPGQAGPSAPPAWAKRAQARQRAAHGATLLAHTIHAGDAGGSGAGPSLRDPSN